MFYVILVSHGEFAPGLHTALDMIAGKRDTVLSLGLREDMGADHYEAAFREATAHITNADRIVLLADIIGGSPLTTAMKVLAQRELLPITQAFGGLSLPMALTAVLAGEGLAGQILTDTLLAETKAAVAEFVLEADAETEDDI